MTLTATKTVRELAVEIPNATRVFEKLGIDYCCGGARSLDEACEAANLSIDQVLAQLNGAAQPAAPADRDWQTALLAELVEHIVSTHHAYVREETARMHPLLAKVCKVHGQNHPELLAISDTFDGLAQELTMHMMKEEVVLFPHIVRMEESLLQKEPVLPPPFGTVKHPVDMMMHEHDLAGDALRKLRELSSSYQAPADGCFSYRTLYQALEAFEADLHQHIHLENNILFPRAIKMERTK
jgi:regulator of cell morphogenesis and NO signaling